MHLTLKKTLDAATQVRVSRVDGSELPVRLRLLGYDSCEFESDQKFTPGEEISIHLFRMGSIRARILSGQTKVVEAEFLKDCPI